MAQEKASASKNTMRLSLRAGEKIYINGAVLRADRKVSLELLNDATFLLENHVLQPEQTTTPLRQLYFAAQIMLINPAVAEQAGETFKAMLKAMLKTFEDAEILKGLKLTDELVHQGRVFEALKTLRGLYPIEAAIMGSDEAKREPRILTQVSEAVA
ncbi:flagellar biosynthesis repressor FlbT [Paramesorhizobium deserti]|uniref:Probable flagellum biosynthesis repressor protein FlbT n=1 Tax=Paramesorhizobium deserti TaxID=1494590 RepID=A0A135HS40_9HYPH|nr:flagellar biosynthesis repressor FlbT [Paramesorhizobium deserti]KXF76008.1 flagellar biosynthesis repressor FlbT [Paramesorhizobium deserti]